MSQCQYEIVLLFHLSIVHILLLAIYLGTDECCRLINLGITFLVGQTLLQSIIFHNTQSLTFTLFF